MSMNPGRPTADEYAPFYAGYIALASDALVGDVLVGDGNLIAQIERQRAMMHALLAPCSGEQLHFRPTPADWNILQVLGHITDGEQVFAYRALRIARGDTTPLAGFEQDDYVAAACSDTRSIADLLEAYDAQRRASIALLKSFDTATWLRRGTASSATISVRALGYIIAGHELYHLADFKARYRIG